MYSSKLVRRAFFIAIASAIALVVAPSLFAEDRPTELPYASPTSIPQLDASYQHAEDEVVLITAQALRPRRIVIQEGERVAWKSQAPQPSAIVFEREVAKDMICHGLVNFVIEEDELRSALMHAGEFASFCELKPGRYRYKVVRPDAGKSATGSRRRIEGEIVVEARSS